MPDEGRQTRSDQTSGATSEMTRQPQSLEAPEQESSADAIAARSKLSVNVSHDISERLRSLAYTHRLSESSIVEVALTMFFARGDDEILGVILKQLGATLRRR
jgi:predicted transcriptional regulator